MAPAAPSSQPPQPARAMSRADKAIRAGAVAGVCAVGAVAGWVSYEHALTVVSAYGEAGAVGHVYPVTVDGLIFGASMVLLDSARRRVRPPRLTWPLLLAGIGATLFANVLAGLHYGALGAAVAAWPALALVGTYELLMMLVRGQAPKDAPAAPQPPAVPVPVSGSGAAGLQAGAAPASSPRWDRFPVPPAPPAVLNREPGTTAGTAAGTAPAGTATGTAPRPGAAGTAPEPRTAAPAPAGTGTETGTGTAPRTAAAGTAPGTAPAGTTQPEPVPAQPGAGNRAPRKVASYDTFLAEGRRAETGAGRSLNTREMREALGCSKKTACAVVRDLRGSPPEEEASAL